MEHKLILSALLLASFLQGCHTQACGSAPLNPLIVGGNTATKGKWPWQVFQEIWISGGNTLMCGGALINKQWVLTAAHCLYGRPALETYLYLGLNERSIYDPNLVYRSVIQVEMHKDYNPKTLENDIALLKMKTPVKFNKHIQPVCLAQKGSTFFTGVKAWVAGFGETSQGGATSNFLREVSVPIVGDNECKCKNTVPIPPKTVCAGYKQGGKDACQGDSGGPLVVKENTTWVQIGIVSFGEGCAKPDTPRVYTDVSEFQDWIESIVGTEDPPGFITYNSTGVDSDENYNCVYKLTTELPTTTTATTAAPTTVASATTLITSTTMVICLFSIILNLLLSHSGV